MVLLDPFGGVVFEFYLVLLDPFGDAIFEFYLVLFWTRLVVQSLSLILLNLCDGYVGRSVITNMPIYLVHCDTMSYVTDINGKQFKKQKKQILFDLFGPVWW